MNQDKLENLLTDLAKATEQRARPGFAEDIKHNIPQKLLAHRSADTVSIMIDLRINKLAAAVVIIVTLILCANFFAGTGSTGKSIFHDTWLWARYRLAGPGETNSDLLAGASRVYENLLLQGKNVTYFGDSVNPGNSRAILMYWKDSRDHYTVIFANLSKKSVSAEELIAMQAVMLQKRTE